MIRFRSTSGLLEPRALKSRTRIAVRCATESGRPRHQPWVYWSIAIVLVVLSALAWPLFLRESPTPGQVWPLSRGVEEAAKYLVLANNPDGRFEYLRYVAGGEAKRDKYNIVRHAGAIWALADYQEWTTDGVARETAVAAIERATRYLLSQTRPISGRPDVLAVWSTPNRGRNSNAKLGASALAIVALLSGNSKDLTTVDGLARFLVFMQKDSGDFYSRYESEFGSDNESDSLYYPGEAILALTLLYETDHDSRWIDSAARGVAYLVDSRRAGTRLPNDHWLMIAIDRLLPHYNDLVSPRLTREDMVNHAVALGTTMMNEQRAVLAGAHPPEVDGSFLPDGRITPTATRLEGLLALEHAIDRDPKRADFRAALRACIQRGIAFLRRSQLRDGSTRGGFPVVVEGPAAARSPQDRDQRTVRIDYVQHALSAFLRYDRMGQDSDSQL